MIDFVKLARKEVVPQFKPDVRDETDTKYVPRTYLQAKPEDSVDTTVRFAYRSRRILRGIGKETSKI